MYIGIGVAVLFGAVYFWTSFLQTTAEVRGETAQKERVVADGDYRIANYDWFYEQCSAIEAKNQKIQLLEEQIASTDDESQKAGYESGLLAEKTTRAELITDYNAKAASGGTRGQYRDAGLPKQIDPNDEEIQCGTV